MLMFLHISLKKPVRLLLRNYKGGFVEEEQKKMNKKAKTKMGPVWTILILAAIIGGIYYFGGFGGTTASLAGNNVQIGDVWCPDDGVTTFQYRYKDTLAASDTQYAVTGYLIPAGGNSDFETLNAGSATAGTYSTADNMVCDPQNPGVYDFIVATLQNTSHSADFGSPIVISGPAMKEDINGKNYGDLQFRMRNIDTDTYYRLNATNATSFDEALYNGGYLTNDATVSGDITTVGTDGTISIEIPIKTGAVREQFGEDGLRTYVVIDADTTDWDEPIVRWKGQSSKSDVKLQMAETDQDYFTNFEYAYEIGPIGDATKYLEITFDAADGVNPDMDPILYFCAEGRYLSGDEADTIKVGCWDDDSSQTVLLSQVASGITNGLLLNIN
jgi:hypothetical protein